LKNLRILAVGALFPLAAVLPAAELAPDSSFKGLFLLSNEGKFVHALRAVDMALANYPRDPRLLSLKQQLVEAVAREMPPMTAPTDLSRTSRRPAITHERAEPGRDFVTITARVNMIWIRPGTFLMSATHGSDDDTWVTHTRGYWLGQTEVTQEQWQAMVEENPFPSHFKGSDRPVEWVSWVSAMEFCRRVNERERAEGRLPEGYEYTLPTEAQWEYACRAGTTGSFAGDVDALAWHAGNSGQQSHPVAQKPPNAWGFYDLHGNVWEWCRDSYGGYPGGHVLDPRRDEIGSDSGSPCVIRGGAWGNAPGTCRSAFRAKQGLNYTGASVGFRLALAPILARPPPSPSAGDQPSERRR
jgi:formylglycine-generating enzyme required for sulfatase activity